MEDSGFWDLTYYSSGIVSDKSYYDEAQVTKYKQGEKITHLSKTVNSNMCPNCGAYRTNKHSENCEYCGSLVFSSIVSKVSDPEPIMESKVYLNRLNKFWRE